MGKHVAKSVWNATDPETIPGPLGTAPLELRKNLLANKRFLDQLRFDNNTLLGLAVTDYGYMYDGYVYYRPEIGIPLDADYLLLAIEEVEQKRSDVDRQRIGHFELRPNGDVVDIDKKPEDGSYEPDERDIKLIKDAIQRLQNELDARLRKARDRRERVLSAIKWITAWLTAIAMVCAVVGYLYYHFGYAPAKADRDARARYDANAPVIPGSLNRLQFIEPGILPEDVFNAIPTSKGKDEPLSSPRLVTLTDKSRSGKTGVSCTNLPQSSSADSIKVATTQNSVIRTGKLYLSVASDDTLELCGAGKAFGSNGQSLDLRVAVQSIR